MNLLLKCFFVLAVFAGTNICANEGDYFLEAEHFADYGGWVHDSQFMDQMGSPFLLAHGLGHPVKDAETTIMLPAGDYNVWVRTRDWCAPWKENVKNYSAPGRFQILINSKPLDAAFGTESAEWHWQNGGIIAKNDFQENRLKIVLHDLTGFEGRIDAIYFQKITPAVLKDWNSVLPPNDLLTLKIFRKKLLGLPDEPEAAGNYDLVVVGGGIAGTCAAVSAARSGLKVALIQDRPVLGGNNSSEVRVWLHGARNLDPLPNIGNIVEELEQAKRAHEGAANTAELYEDERKLELVKAEKNITLFLEYRVNDVRISSDSKQITIKSVIAQQTKTGRSYRFDAPLFADTTGDGCVGFLAGADIEMTVEEGHLGRCNLWNVIDTKEPQMFPRCPWAVDLTDKPFQGRGRNNPLLLGTWEWESGFYLDPIEKSEYIRDLNFRACYGAWDALKNVDKAFPNYKLNWMAHIAGKRESRRIMGDVVLNKNTVLINEKFEDVCVPTGWAFDLHLPNKNYNQGQNRGDEFLSAANFTHYKTPYWLPYRILYSRNVNNLFMAGRDVSVSHEALGTVRVMRTGGCMGEVVGLAAAICKEHGITPREVYSAHLAQFQEAVKRGVPHSPDFKERTINERVDVPNGWIGFSPAKKLPVLQTAPQNIANKAAITVSSNQNDAAFLNDGKLDWKDNTGRWISDAADKPEIVFNWKEPVEVRNIRIVSGYNTGGSITAPVEGFTLSTTASELVQITGNTEADVRKEFSKVKTNELRLKIDKTKDGRSRIWEIEIY